MNILRKSTVLATVAVAMAVCAGCTREQSSFSIEDLKGRTKISGILSYNLGQAYENGKYSELHKVAADKPVYVRVNNTSYSLTGAAFGYTQFETKTNANGEYEIEVPVPDKGAQIFLSAPSFAAKRTLLESWENGPVFKNQEVIFEMNETSLTVYPNDILFKDLKYGFTPRESQASLVTEVPLTVRVDANLSSTYQSGISVVITVRYDGILENNSVMYRNYGATTDSNGEAKFKIPAPQTTWSDVSITIRAIPHRVERFKYNDNNILGGTYKQCKNGSLALSGVTDKVSFDGAKEVVKEIKMVFVPDEGVETYGYNWSNYAW